MLSLDLDNIMKNMVYANEESIKKELKIDLKDKYNIEIKKIQKNEQSTEGNVYIVHSKDEKYVIKIYNDIKHTKSMVKLHDKLSKLKLNVPNVILDKQKKGYQEISNTNYFVVYSFIKGEQIGWDNKNGKLDHKIIASIAKELRKIHKNTPNNEFDLPKVPLKNNSKNQSVLHFDLTRNNIFRDDNQISFIDFDDAKYGDSLYDVAILIANIFFSKTRGVDLQGMRKFVDEYYCNENALKEEEVPLIKEYALSWINYILQGNQFDTSTTESLEVRYKMIKENL